jgi:hypothetical protein
VSNSDRRCVVASPIRLPAALRRAANTLWLFLPTILGVGVLAGAYLFLACGPPWGSKTDPASPGGSDGAAPAPAQTAVPLTLEKLSRLAASAAGRAEWDGRLVEVFGPLVNWYDTGDPDRFLGQLKVYCCGADAIPVCARVKLAGGSFPALPEGKADKVRGKLSFLGQPHGPAGMVAFTAVITATSAKDIAVLEKTIPVQEVVEVDVWVEGQHFRICPDLLQSLYARKGGSVTLTWGDTPQETIGEVESRLKSFGIEVNSTKAVK